MGYPTDINDLQYDLKTWTEKQFPKRTTKSIAAHLRKETTELEAAPHDIMEYADCMMLLMDAASFNGIRVSDIILACYDKLEINKQRTWGEVNDEGFVEHVKPDNESEQHSFGESEFIPVDLLLKPDLTDADVESWRKQNLETKLAAVDEVITMLRRRPLPNDPFIKSGFSEAIAAVVTMRNSINHEGGAV